MMAARSTSRRAGLLSSTYAASMVYVPPNLLRFHPRHDILHPAPNGLAAKVTRGMRRLITSVSMVFTVSGKEYFAITNDMLSETREEAWPRTIHGDDTHTYAQHKQITNGDDTHEHTHPPHSKKLRSDEVLW